MTCPVLMRRKTYREQIIKENVMGWKEDNNYPCWPVSKFIFQNDVTKINWNIFTKFGFLKRLTMGVRKDAIAKKKKNSSNPGVPDSKII